MKWSMGYDTGGTMLMYDSGVCYWGMILGYNTRYGMILGYDTDV